MPEPDTLRRTALLLVWVGLVWNAAEAVVAFWAGALAGSVALLAFGGDSVIELFAGGVLVWRLTRERHDAAESAAEGKAQQLVGITFFLLAGYVFVHSGASLLGLLPRPEPSLAGVGIAVASAVVMTGLYLAKMRIAARMQSRSLRAEAVESLFCDLQDLAVLVGLGFNFLLSWWWADPVACLILIPFFIKEGREHLFGDEDEDEPDHAQETEPGSGRVRGLICFCRSCFYGLFGCNAVCCRA